MKKKPTKPKAALTPPADSRSAASLPAGYAELLRELKARIRAAQIRAALSVNRETVALYWQIGRDILQRQQQQGWGAKVIDRLSFDLREAFPEMKGFSPRNLKYMRAFAAAWPDEQFVQQLAAQIPWGHNVRILSTATAVNSLCLRNIRTPYRRS
jgi:predicted nuclease of restriction endonuclease-like (RecB) superfamily